MKKILFAMACALSIMAVSCEKVEETLNVQFDKKNYVMTANEALTVKVIASKAPATDLEIPLQISGNAVLDEDYTISAKSVLLKMGTTSAELTLTPKNNLKENLKVALALQAGEGYLLGNAPVAEVAISPKEVIVYSFKQTTGTISNEYAIELNLVGKKSGAEFVAGADLTLPFAVAETSTAKLGTDFTIKDNATAFVIKKGEKSGKITVVAKENAEKPALAPFATFTIVPELADLYEAGVNPSFDLYFQGTFSFADLAGKWSYTSYPLLDDPNCQFFLLEGMILESGDLKEELPSHNTAEDVLEFKNVNGEMSLVPALKGDLKKFFREAIITSIQPITYNFYYYEKNPQWICYELTLSQANKLFSGTQEDLKEAKVIISLRNEGKTLDVVVRDYVPTDFLSKIYTYADGAIYQFQPELWDQYFLFTKLETE